MANVIREDIIKIEYDIDNSGLNESLKMLENFKKALGLDTSEIDEANESFNETAESCEKLKDSVSKFKEEVSGGLDTSEIDGLKDKAQ